MYDIEYTWIRLETLMQEELHEADEAGRVHAGYEIAITGDGMTFKRSVTESTVRDILLVVLGGGSLLAAPNQSPSPVARNGARSVPEQSVGEFLLSAEAKRNVDKIAAIGMYLTETLGQPQFSREDVRAKFQEAGEPTPANFPRDFNGAVSLKWIARSAGSKEEFYLTTSGRQAVEARFSESVRRTPTTPSRRRSRKKSEGNANE